LRLTPDADQTDQTDQTDFHGSGPSKTALIRLIREIRVGECVPFILLRSAFFLRNTRPLPKPIWDFRFRIRDLASSFILPPSSFEIPGRCRSRF